MEAIRTATGKEARRRLAVQRVRDGWSQADVADILGVHPVTVNKWVRAYRAAGDGGLASNRHPGRKPFLTPGQEAEVLGWPAGRPTTGSVATCGPPAGWPT
jgi:transposase